MPLGRRDVEFRGARATVTTASRSLSNARRVNGCAADRTENKRMATISIDEISPARVTPAWSAVYAMSLCVFVLIASEFMPVSLLTPIAHELPITEGQAGQ